MLERDAINLVEDAKKIPDYDAYRTVGGHVAIIYKPTGWEVLFSNSKKEVAKFISQLPKVPKLYDMPPGC